MLEVSCEIRAGRPFPVRAKWRLDGGALCLFGPSGAGKSTLLSAIAGFLPLHAGEIRWTGRVMADARRQTPPWRRRFAYVEQQANLFSHLTVRQNILYGTKHGRRNAAMDIVDMLELGRHLDRRPRDLSGGQRQRVALARALASDPVLLLLDEPFSALDIAAREHLMDVLGTFIRDRNLPTVLVSHQFTDVQRFGDSVAVMDRGSVVRTGGPRDVFARPQTRRVAEMVGYRHFLQLSADALAAVHPDRVRFGAHPELGPVYEGRVRRVYPYEGRMRALVELNAGEATEAAEAAYATEAPNMIEAALPDSGLAAGDCVRLTLIDPPRLAAGAGDM